VLPWHFTEGTCQREAEFLAAGAGMILLVSVPRDRDRLTSLRNTRRSFRTDHEIVFRLLRSEFEDVLLPRVFRGQELIYWML